MCQSSLSAHFGNICEICSTSLSPRPDKHYDKRVSYENCIEGRLAAHHDNVGFLGKRLGQLNGTPDGVSRLEG